jgi:hypothetical protein
LVCFEIKLIYLAIVDGKPESTEMATILAPTKGTPYRQKNLEEQKNSGGRKLFLIILWRCYVRIDF